MIQSFITIQRINLRHLKIQDVKKALSRILFTIIKVYKK